MKTNQIEAVSFTPGEWAVVESGHALYIVSANRDTIAEVFAVGSTLDRQTPQANAARIVLCVNSHDALLEACKDALESLKRLPDADGAYRVTCLSQLESAIRKASNE